MRQIALLVEYDGTAYAGWQSQANAPSIQDAVEKGLAKLLGKATRVKGAGRTDAGVHAEGQVCTFRTARDLPLTAFSGGLNRFLPRDIRITGAREVAAGFDVIRHATRKCYSYEILARGAPTALLRDRVWQVREKLDWRLIRRVAKQLEGAHDFAAFRSSRASSKTTRRVIESVQIRAQGPRYTLIFIGNGFLRGQVRSMVGTLITIGRGAAPEDRILQVLKRPDRDLVGPNAPAAGLTLRWVDYGEGPWKAPGGALFRS